MDLVVEDECLKLHNIDQIFNELIFLQGKQIATGMTDVETARIRELTEDLSMAWGRVVTYDVLQQYPRICDDDIFFEKLLVNCTKAALRVQNLVKKAESFDRNAILKRLSSLKNNVDYDVNFEEIQQLENRLNILL